MVLLLGVTQLEGTHIMFEVTSLGGLTEANESRAKCFYFGPKYDTVQTCNFFVLLKCGQTAFSNKLNNFVNHY